MISFPNFTKFNKHCCCATAELTALKLDFGNVFFSAIIITWEGFPRSFSGNYFKHSPKISSRTLPGISKRIRLEIFSGVVSGIFFFRYFSKDSFLNLFRNTFGKIFKDSFCILFQDSGISARDICNRFSMFFLYFPEIPLKLLQKSF